MCEQAECEENLIPGMDTSNCTCEWYDLSLCFIQWIFLSTHGRYDEEERCGSVSPIWINEIDVTECQENCHGNDVSWTLNAVEVAGDERYTIGALYFKPFTADGTQIFEGDKTFLTFEDKH